MFEDEAVFHMVCSELTAAISGILIAKGATAATAESLTGGLIASEIVSVPGASKWFLEGAVTYSNGAKASRLLCDPSIIERHTAVSRPVAKMMAEGMRKTSGADIAVSTTGLAGPGKDELGRDAGLVFIGGSTSKGFVTRELNLSGSRTEIRRQAVYEALKLLYKLAKTI